MKEVHVCLLSNQLLPNLIPAFMERPSRVYLIATQEMRESGLDKRMNRLLRKEKIEVRIRSGVPSAEYGEIRKYAAKLATELVSAEAGKKIVLNATGGTKLLSMGFVDVFRERLEGYPVRVIYTDTAHRAIETLVPRDQPPSSMRDVLTVDTYLAAQGMALQSAASDQSEWRDAVRKRAPVTEFFAENCAELGPFFGTINGMVHGRSGNSGALSRNGESLIQPRQEFNRRPQDLWREALTRIADSRLLDWDGDKVVHFESPEYARYLGGRWLEEYAWLTAEAADLRDVRASALGRWERESGADAPTNEFDLLAAHGNRILIVECKTGMHGASEQAVATRLESLERNAGGLFGASLLLSARGLSTSMKKRCTNLRIPVLEKEKIRELHARMETWRDTGRIPPD